MGISKIIPQGTLTLAEVEALEQHDKFDGTHVILEFSGDVITFVLEHTDGRAVGLHCDHNSGEWDSVAKGDDVDVVLKETADWLDDDMDRAIDEL